MHRLQDAVSLTRPDGTPAARAFDVGMQAGERAGDPVRFAAVVNRMLRDNPPPASEADHVARFAAVGIGADCNAQAMDEAQRDAIASALAELDAELAAPVPSDLGGGWSLPVELLSTFGERYDERALVARNYIGALGMEEAMYLIADCDGDGQPLDGRASYELVFPAGGLPQVDAFWSLTLYRKSDCMLVENPLCRYSLGDRSPDLRHEADGSLRLLLGMRAPERRPCKATGCGPRRAFLCHVAPVRAAPASPGQDLRLSAHPARHRHEVILVPGSGCAQSCRALPPRRVARVVRVTGPVSPAVQ